MSCRSSAIRLAMSVALWVWASAVGAASCQLPDERTTPEPRDELLAVQQAIVCIQTRPLAAGTLPPLDELNAAKDREADAASKIDFEERLGLGLGVGYAWGRGPDRVEEAEVVNGVVRVQRSKTDGPRLFFEAHRFLWTFNNHNHGLGPFVSIQTGADDALSSWGVGLMFGAREKATQNKGVAQSTSNSWNLGVGYLWDDDVQLLGDGIVANEPLPSGETEIRFKRTSVGSVFMMFSRKF